MIFHRADTKKFVCSQSSKWKHSLASCICAACERSCRRISNDADDDDNVDGIVDDDVDDFYNDDVGGGKEETNNCDQIQFQ